MIKSERNCSVSFYEYEMLRCERSCGKAVAMRVMKSERRYDVSIQEENILNVSISDLKMLRCKR